MDGYVIVGETGMFLSRYRKWVERKATKAYVFTVKATERILAWAKEENLTPMPTQIIPAHYQKRRNNKVIGPARSAYPD